MKTTNENNIIEVMFEGDKTAESNKFESRLFDFFEMQRLKVQIIKATYDDRIQLIGVYGVDEAKKIKKHWFSLYSFLANIAENIGFEIAERQQSSKYAAILNESGFTIQINLRHVG